MNKISLDHCVIHVSDWGQSNPFYTKVLGAELGIGNLLSDAQLGAAIRWGSNLEFSHAKLRQKPLRTMPPMCALARSRTKITAIQ